MSVRRRNSLLHLRRPQSNAIPASLATSCIVVLLTAADLCTASRSPRDAPLTCYKMSQDPNAPPGIETCGPGMLCLWGFSQGAGRPYMYCAIQSSCDRSAHPDEKYRVVCCSTDLCNKDHDTAMGITTSTSTSTSTPPTTTTPSTTTPETTSTSSATTAVVHVKTTAQEHPTTTEATTESTTDDTAQPLPPTTTTEHYTGPLKCLDGVIYDDSPLDDQLKRIEEKDCDGGQCFWSFGPWGGTMALASDGEKQDYDHDDFHFVRIDHDQPTVYREQRVALQSAPSNLTSSSTSAAYSSSESSPSTVSVPTTEPHATATPGSSVPYGWIALIGVGIVGALVFAVLSLLAFLGIICAPKQSPGLNAVSNELVMTLV